MSTLIAASASGEKMPATAPGRSGTAVSVTFASFLSCAMPVMSWRSTCPSTSFLYLVLADDHRAGQVAPSGAPLERGKHLDAHLLLHRQPHRARLQHLGADRRQLQHLLVGDAWRACARGHDPRIGGVDAVDVGIDVAAIGLHRRRDRDRAGIRSAAAERGDAAARRSRPGSRGSPRPRHPPSPPAARRCRPCRSAPRRARRRSRSAAASRATSVRAPPAPGA